MPANKTMQGIVSLPTGVVKFSTDDNGVTTHKEVCLPRESIKRISNFGKESVIVTTDGKLLYFRNDEGAFELYPGEIVDDAMLNGIQMFAKIGNQFCMFLFNNPIAIFHKIFDGEFIRFLEPHFAITTTMIYDLSIQNSLVIPSRLNKDMQMVANQAGTIIWVLHLGKIFIIDIPNEKKRMSTFETEEVDKIFSFGNKFAYSLANMIKIVKGNDLFGIVLDADEKIIDINEYWALGRKHIYYHNTDGTLDDATDPNVCAPAVTDYAFLGNSIFLTTEVNTFKMTNDDKRD